MVTLCQITFRAQHLAVIRRTLSASAPWDNVIRLHLLKFKFFPTDRTFIQLCGISCQPVTHIELPDLQLAFIAGQQIFINP